MDQAFGFGDVPRWEIDPEYAREILRQVLNPNYNPFEAGAYQEPAHEPQQQPQAQQEHAYFPPQPDYYQEEYAAGYNPHDEDYNPEYEEPQARGTRRRDRRRHDGNRGQRNRAQGPRPRVHYGPLLNILQPVANGADRTMDMSLNAFNALFEEQADGYVPGMYFKDLTGASITGFKNQDGLRATIVVRGSERQVAAAYELLEDHNFHYSVDDNIVEDEAVHAPPHRRRRRRGRGRR
ncbi:hypothetical protein VTL71DRAFT_8151 [Oculimacula yallundae]|uniref:Uncharacterized protein n=1 Tax=Oculimacula yallundae TaxID=86028 RepID=A0ABR4CWR3_9HELO